MKQKKELTWRESNSNSLIGNCERCHHSKPTSWFNATFRYLYPFFSLETADRKQVFSDGGLLFLLSLDISAVIQLLSSSSTPFYCYYYTKIRNIVIHFYYIHIFKHHIFQRHSFHNAKTKPCSLNVARYCSLLRPLIRSELWWRIQNREPPPSLFISWSPINQSLSFSILFFSRLFYAAFWSVYMTL